jgi:hypothetical protein
MPGERFLADTARGAPLFPVDVIRGYANNNVLFVLAKDHRPIVPPAGA